MAQYLECRKCRSFRWIPGCSSGGQVIRCAHVAGPGGELCPGWWLHAEPFTPKPEAPPLKPRETPLLVDALAEALKGMLTLPYRPLRSSSVQAARIDMVEANAKAAVSRYQEEVGDA